MPETPDNITPSATPPKKKYVRAVGPRLRILLLFIFGLVAVLAAAGIVLIASKFVADALVTKLSDKLHTGAGSQIQDQTNNLVKHLESRLFQSNTVQHARRVQ